MRKVALVFAGGFCGALARYLLATPLLALAVHLAPAAPQGFPFDILFINLTGALSLGLLYGLFERGAAISPEARLLIGTGFLGAYTTFSTYIYGADRLLTGGAALVGWLYLFGSLALGVGCARLGYVSAGVLLSRRRLLRRGRIALRRIRGVYWRGTGVPGAQLVRSDATADTADGVHGRERTREDADATDARYKEDHEQQEVY